MLAHLKAMHQFLRFPESQCSRGGAEESGRDLEVVLSKWGGILRTIFSDHISTVVCITTCVQSRRVWGRRVDGVVCMRPPAGICM